MDKNKIRGLVEKSLKDLDYKNLDLKIDNDNIHLEIISDSFKGMNLTSRLSLISEKLVNLASGDLSDFHFLINPLTVNEKINGISETVNRNFDGDSGFTKVASSPSL